MATTEIHPTLVRRQLGLRLRRLREQAGKTVEDVIAADFGSKTKLWRLESGRGAVKKADVILLARIYGASEKALTELLKLADATKATGYAEDYAGAVSQPLGLYAELEEVASAIVSYSSELLHGLVQTPDYTRAVISTNKLIPPNVVEQRVTFRIERQRRFLEHSGTGRLEVIATAGAMNLQVGSASVMEEQIAHLRAVSNTGAARISVLPATNGLHRAVTGPFVLLDFENPDDPSVVYIESFAGSRYVERPTDVARFRDVLDDMRQLALPLEEWLQ